MRRTGLGLAFLTLLGILPLAAQRSSPTASATAAPRLEVAFSYSNVRAQTVITTGCCFNLNGGTVSAAFNLNGWLGVVGDFGGEYTGSVQKSPFSLSIISYTFGPRISLRKSEHFTPFVQALFGGAHAGGTLYTRAFSAGGTLGAKDSFAAAIGGGVDVNFSRRVAVRLVQADWLYTQFPNGGTNSQHDLRLATGIVFRFDGR